MRVNSHRKQLLESLQDELRNLESYRAFLAIEVLEEEEKKRSWLRIERNTKMGLAIALTVAAPLVAFELYEREQGASGALAYVIALVALLVVIYLLQEKFRVLISKVGESKSGSKADKLLETDQRIQQLKDEIVSIEIRAGTDPHKENPS